MNADRTLVLGAGITGLSAAWHLTRDGRDVTVLEAGQRPGGAIETHHDDGYLVEMGPNTLMVDDKVIEKFLFQAVPKESIQYGNSEADKRFIVRDGAPRAIPMSPVQAVTTKLWPKTAMLRVLKELFLPPYSGDAEESLADFVRRRLGQTMLDYAINPFVAGVYAGDPESLSVQYGFPKLYNLEQNYGGSLIRGSLKLKKERARTGQSHKAYMVSFPDGLSFLPETLAGSLANPVIYGAAANSISRAADGAYRVAYRRDGRDHTLEADSVIIALPTRALTGLTPGDGIAGGLEILDEIEYPPVTSLALGFPRSAVAHPLDGFGMLIPEVEKHQILGTLFSSTLFPGRAPDGHVLLTSFIGGTRQPQNAELDDARLIDITLKELRELVGAEGDPVYRSIRRWPAAIPQYKIGYGKYLDAMERFERANPGIFIAGHIRDGISLAKCIRGGIRARDAVLAFSRESDQPA